MDGDYELVIGSKNLSSWSLRPWLVLKAFNIPFKETLILLRRPDSRDNILRHSPSGKVPVLKSGSLTIWDSLAIIEFLAEGHPDAPIWPPGPEARAMARCVAAEMHSGFPALRDEFPMSFIDIIGFPKASDKALDDISRIVEIWTGCRRRFGDGGAFLFGDFSAADAMFGPVASRFRSYEVDLARFGDDGSAARYRDAMMAMPEMQLWAEGARAEV